MTDEIPNPENQPIEAEVVPNAPQPKSHVMVSKLSTLPPEILEELDTRLKNNEPVKTVRDDMILKYPSVEDLKVGYLTWMKRAKKLNGGTPTEVKDGTVAKKEMVNALPSAEDLQKAVSSVLDLNLSVDRKQEALSSLFNKATQRLGVLESKQQGFINPETEALMLSYMKEARALLETVTKLQEVLNRDILSGFKSELDELIRTVLTTVYSSYRLEHPDIDPTSKFDGFRSTLESHLSKTLQQYKQSKP